MAASPRYHRKVIRIRAEDSPTVRLALAEIAAGKEPSNRILVPGILQYDDGIRGYVYRRKHWDEVRQKIGLDGEFPKDSSVLMFPPDWLDHAERNAEGRGLAGRKALGMGVDSAQGGDNTCWAPVDRFGLLELVGEKTPDTTTITTKTITTMSKWGCDPENALFDVGGGGYQHVSRLRKQGYRVNMVNFGASASRSRQRARVFFLAKVEEDETRLAYKNKRSEMYGMLRRVLDPDEGTGFGLPAEMLSRSRKDGGPSLREQLSAIPMDYDDEGRVWLRPKNKRDKDSTKKTLTELIGCSPDEADALVLGVYSMTSKPVVAPSGVMF